jgi:hypothetical protein
MRHAFEDASILATAHLGKAGIGLTIIGGLAILLGILRILGLLPRLGRRDQNPLVVGLILILIGGILLAIGITRLG